MKGVAGGWWLMVACIARGVSSSVVVDGLGCLAIAEKNDGFGAQYHAHMSAYAWAAHVGSRFCFSGVKTMHDLKIDKVAHFGASALTMMQGTMGFEPKNCSACQHAASFVREVETASSPVDALYTQTIRNELRKRYYRGAGKVSVFGPRLPAHPSNKTNVAVHIRTGFDAERGKRHREAWFYLAVIQGIRKLTPDALFHIYSQGTPCEFRQYSAPDVKLHLDTSVLETFHSFVTADILVTGPSDFSWSAALLRTGTVFATPMWFHPLAHWVVIVNTEPDASASCGTLCDVLQVPLNDTVYKQSHAYLEIKRPMNTAAADGTGRCMRGGLARDAGRPVRAPLHGCTLLT